MDSPRTRQLLKVLSGPQAGGELLLADGEYVIGSDDASEIVLLDERVAARHARLTVRDGAVECRGLDGARVSLDGAGTDGAQLAPYQCFTLGATHLAVGPAEETWPAVRLPDAPPPEAVNRQASASDDEPVGAAEPGAAGEPEPSASAAAPLPGAALQQVSTEKRSPGGFWAALIGAVVVLAGLIAFVMFLLSSNPAETPVVSREVQLATIENAIEKLGFGKTVAVTDQHNRFVVAGHVPLPADKREVREAVHAIDPTARIRVYDAQTLLANFKDMLRINRLDFTATSGGPGEVIVGGLLRDLAAWQRVRGRILTDMPQLETLTENFANVPRVQTALPETTVAGDAEGDNADESVAASDAGDSENDEDANEEAAPAVVAQPPVQPLLPVEEPEIPSLPPIQGISHGGPIPSITLATGERVFPGAVLENGYTVKAIEARRVVLSRGGRVHIIRIGS